MFDYKYILLFVIFLNQIESTPLDDYVHADNPHFGWEILNIYHESEYTLYILNFTLQKWLDGSLFS
jgi:hypothetical protein